MLADKDRIFTNVYGYQPWNLTAAQARGDWDGTKALLAMGRDKIVDEIKAKGGDAVANYDSVSTPEGGAAIVKTAVDACGKVDIVVNNAGTLRDKSFLKLTCDDMESVIDVHHNGPLHFSHPPTASFSEQQ